MFDLSSTVFPFPRGTEGSKFPSRSRGESINEPSRGNSLGRQGLECDLSALTSAISDVAGYDRGSFPEAYENGRGRAGERGPIFATFHVFRLPTFVRRRLFGRQKPLAFFFFFFFFSLAARFAAAAEAVLREGRLRPTEGRPPRNNGANAIRRAVMPFTAQQGGFFAGIEPDRRPQPWHPGSFEGKRPTRRV